MLTLLDIPFAVSSPVVAGLVYLLFYGSNGLLGGWLDEHNLQNDVPLSPGMVLSLFCHHLPVCGARTGASDAFGSGQSGRSEAAILLGASGWQMFLPRDVAEYLLALLYGVVLTSTPARLARVWRGVGEPPDSRRKRYRYRYRLNYWSASQQSSAPLPPPHC